MATAISTLHDQHQWEGVILKPAELRRYEVDKTSLIQDFFQRVPSSSLILAEENGEAEILEESDDAKETMIDLLEEKIEPYTLRQGKFLSQFSFIAHKKVES